MTELSVSEVDFYGLTRNFPHSVATKKVVPPVGVHHLSPYPYTSFNHVKGAQTS
jgi:hypothetical protein